MLQSELEPVLAARLILEFEQRAGLVRMLKRADIARLGLRS